MTCRWWYRVMAGEGPPSTDVVVTISKDADAGPLPSLGAGPSSACRCGAAMTRRNFWPPVSEQPEQPAQEARRQRAQRIDRHRRIVQRSAHRIIRGEHTAATL